MIKNTSKLKQIELKVKKKIYEVTQMVKIIVKFFPEDYIRNLKVDNMKIVLADFRRLNADSRRVHYDYSIQMVSLAIRY